MSRIKGTVGSKVLSTVLSLTTAFWLSGVAYFAPAVAQAQTVEDLQAQISSLLAQISSLQAQLSGMTGGGSTSGFVHVFNQNLSLGDSNDEVKALQQALDLQGCFTFGSYTGYFGPITRDAVNCFQSKYASEVLTPLGLSGATGFVGPGTRAKLNALFGTAGVPGTPETPSDPGTGTVPSGTGLMVSTTAQPSNSLAVENAASLPYTKFKLTAGSDGAVTVNSVTIERQGLMNDGVVSGVILLDDTGNRVGTAKTLNSLHQAKLDAGFTIPAGQTKEYTVAVDMAASLDAYSGQVGLMAVVAVDAGSAAVSGSLPITGASHTTNISLVIGSVAVPIRGPLDPGSSQDKKVGEIGYTFSSIRITAGSAEKIRLNSIRWNQSGSAATGDIGNIKTYVDGTAYDTAVSADGKYYVANFGSGIVIDKGFSKEVSIKGDVVSGSGRTIDFDIYRRTDLSLVGETFGYGITVDNGTQTTGTDDGLFHTAEPWFDAFQVTITGGSINVSSAASVPSQNVSENVPNQPLGGFDVEVKGEEVSVAQMVFYFQITRASGSSEVADLTSISLYNESGTVVAGPVDGSGAAVSGTATFSDTVIFPIGTHTYTLKGKVGSDFESNDTIVASTTPSGWTTVKGQTTNLTITPTPSSQVQGKTMTVKAAAVAISVSSNPVAQNTVSGAQGFTFANYQFDTTASGENLRVVSWPLAYDAVSGSATDLTNCLLYNGSTVVSESVSPTAVSSSTSFTFLSGGITLSKGVVTTLALKCNISGGASGVYMWGYDDGQSPSPTGIASGQTASVTETDSVGQRMTIVANGTLTVTKDSSSPSYAVAAAGTTGNVLGIFKLHADNEAITLVELPLQMSNAAASSSPSDLSKVTLWDGGTQVGEAVFISRYATSTLSGSFVIPKDGDKLLTIKGDFASIGTSLPGTQGSFIQVDFDGGGNGTTAGAKGTGFASGVTIYDSSSDTDVDGVRMFRSYPTLTKIALADTKLGNGEKPALRWSITANNGDVGVRKFTLRLATTSVIASTLNVFAFMESGFNTPVSGVTSGGQLQNSNEDLTTAWASNTSDLEIDVDTSGGADTALQIPAGGTRWFEARLNITGADTSGDSTQLQLQGDATSYSASATQMGTAAAVELFGDDDFIWSPNATTTSDLTHVDWTNGYGLIGLPSTNMTAQSLSY